jgi:hypothetical protein
LAQLDATLWLELETEIKSDVKLRANWATVLRWDDEYRYEIVEDLVAKSLYDATTETVTGVMDWIRRRWK